MTPLRRAALSVAFLACNSGSTGSTPPPNADVATEVVATNLDTVWELAWSPDGFLWMTERAGRVSRVNPETGAVTPVAEIPVTESGEGGLMGLALHPDFPDHPWVYLAHTYRGASGLRNRVVRARYDGTS
ncbi:MAG TPA: PQQ-dependent sugar dehydrogenase, partial [Gemmatimonadaceae bacterium]